ncbi:MAG: hypothetical protein WC895_03455 [Candidatus Shapirobacteria bacterium]|jgi:hypothetical protein
MKKIILKGFLLVVFFLPVFFYLGKFNISKSAPSTNLKDQLSSAQLSYFSRLAVGNTIGDSVIYIQTAGTTLSTTNYNLFIGDTLYIANSTSGNTIYTVKDIAGTNAIALNSAIGDSNVTAGSYVIAKNYAIHNVSFNPQSSITGGKWQVLIKAPTTLENDNLPDDTGFDLGTLVTGSITCPWGIAAAESIGTTVVISNSSYHVVTCPLAAGGTNPIDVGSSIVIGVGNSMLMNPAPAPNHTFGQANATADTYTVILRHLDASSAVIDNDTTTGKIAVTESVRVTAVVDPTITFSIGSSGVTSVGSTICGSPLGSGAPNTTAATVSFGSLNLSAFNNLAQFLQCTTNALNGYVIQTFEDNRLTIIGGSTTIPDTTCPSNSCSITSATAWTDNTVSGFGYALQVGSTSAGAVLGITTAANYKPFGVGFANAQNIISRTDTPNSTDSLYVCYRASVSNFQPAGTYQNEINYIATATF